MKTGMDVTIAGHRAWVEYVKGQSKLEPWHKEPALVVWLGIDSPHSVSGFGITLPLKEYKPDELKKLIEEEGSRRFEEILREHEAERKKMEDQANQKKAAQEIAQKVAKAAGIELLEDER